MAIQTGNSRLAIGGARDVRAETLVDVLAARAALLGDKTAYALLGDGSGPRATITYRELFDRARAIAVQLQQSNLRGERAILLYPAGLDYVAAFFGCLYAGVVAVPAFPPHHNRKNERLAAIVDDARPAIALTTSMLKKKAESFFSSVCVEAVRLESTDVIDPADTELARQSLGTGDGLAYLQYTSGSTSSPRGVMVTHRNVLENLAYIDDGFRHNADSVSLTWLPHFHDMGLVDGILMPLYRGFLGIMMTPAAFLQRPLSWLTAIGDLKVTHSGGPNFAYDLCVRKTTPEQRQNLNLRSWAVAYNGAEPVRRDVLERFAEAFGPAGFRSTSFYPAYGLAEGTLKVSGGGRDNPPVHCALAAEALERNHVRLADGDTEEVRHLVGCGSVGGKTSVLIVDPETCAECGPKSVGEIWVSGPGVAQGYWNRPEDSEQTFRAFTSDTGKGPYLRTGDLGFLCEGELFVTGRLKDLIIIRGRNVYPQDIEATALQSHPGLRAEGGAAFSVEVLGEERLVVVHELETRKTNKGNEIAAAIRQSIAENHEVLAWSVLLIKPGSLPRTSSGKTQRNLCKKMFLEGAFEGEEYSVDPAQAEEYPSLGSGLTTELLRDVPLYLRQIIAGRLGIPEAALSVTEPLSRYGIDSLTSIEIAHEIETTLKSRIPMAALLADTTISQISDVIRDLGPALRVDLKSESEIATKQIAGDLAYPLSRGQQALWFIYQMDPLSPAYNIAGAVRIASSLNVQNLRNTFQALVDLHPMLRVTFGSDRGLAYQRVSSEQLVCFQERDASQWNNQILQSAVEQEARRPFDLEAGPVFRVTLYRIADDQFVLLLAAHHLIADLWSFGVLMNQLGRLYQETGEIAESLLPQPGSYAEYIRRQESMLASAVAEDHWTYWSAQLAGELPNLELPIDKDRPRNQTYLGSSERFDIGVDTSERVRSVSAANHGTLFVTLLAAFQVLLSRYCGQDEILVGSPTAGRESLDFADTIGYFVNPVPIRSVVRARDNFSERVQRTKQTVIDAFYHQDYPFSELVSGLNVPRDPARSPVFQVMFALQKSHNDSGGALAAISLGDEHSTLRVGALQIFGFPLEQRIAQFDLTLTVAEAADDLKCWLEYNTDLFEAATIRRMGSHFAGLLDALVSNHSVPVSRLSYLTESERRQLIEEWGSNEGDLPRFVAIHNQFERHAHQIADAAAVIDEDSVISYGVLNSRASRLSEHLRAIGVAQESSVVLLLRRSVDMIVAAMAVLKSGGAYVPLDPSTNESRVDAILRDLKPSAALSDAECANKLNGQSAPLFYIDSNWADLEPRPVVKAGASVAEDAICYIIYTSGSTGIPKGVAVRHGSLASYVAAANSHYQLGHDDRVLHLASISFDASVDEIFVPLISGSAVIINRDPAATSPAELIELCREKMVTVLSLTTAYWHVLVSSLLAQEWESGHSVRLAVVGGEGALPERLENWFDRIGNRIELLNSYGPTETTVAVTLWKASRLECSYTARVPIGRPILGSYIYCFDWHGQPAPEGVLGEILIGGAGLAQGYLDDPAKTAERFVPDPFAKAHGGRVYRSGDLGRFIRTGDLECAGRLDNQVKIRGFRVEKEEVESALSRVPGVGQAVVTTVDADEAKKLAAYIVPKKQGADLDPQALRSALSGELPPFMIPSYFVFLDRLPANSAGKIDRRLLPPILFDHTCHPRRAGGRASDIEQRIAAIWSRVLGGATVGLDDNFFQLGGDSILSLQAVARAREQGIIFTPRQLFNNPTVSALASVAGLAGNVQREQAPADRAALTCAQHWFFESAFEDPNHWNMALMLEVIGELSIDDISRAFSRLATAHDVLRSGFVFENGGWSQELGAGCFPVARELDLSALSEIEALDAIHTAVASEQTGLNLQQGPLLRAVLFKTEEDMPDRLLIVAHHLIMDAVSLRVLVEQLDRFCSSSEVTAIDERPVTARSWAGQLESIAQTPAILNEIEYWTRLKDARIASLPVDSTGPNRESSTIALQKLLSQAKTQDLLRTVPDIYLAAIDELLLAALADAVCAWAGMESPLIEVERHGREMAGIEMDLSRSIGWFTATCPVLVSGRVDPGGATDWVRAAKEAMRSVPDGGIGFGLLRYVCADPSVRDKMRDLPVPEISFNYLGDLDRAFQGSGRFRRPELITAGTRSGRSQRTHLLEIDAGVLNGNLSVSFRFSGDVFKTETIERLANLFVERLESLIERAMTGHAIYYSTTDFPLATLDQQQLDRLTVSACGIRDIYPLTPGQQGMLFHAIYSDEEDVYAGTLSLSITGDLNHGFFEQAWRTVAARHPIFRTSFAWEGLSEPVQVVHNRSELRVGYLDWTGLSKEQSIERLRQTAAGELAAGFDLNNPPLMRVTMARVSEKHHYVVLALHHLLIDGWSLSLLIDEVLATYRSCAKGDEPGLNRPAGSLRTYIAWLRDQEQGAAAAFWRNELKGISAPAPLPLHNPCSDKNKDNPACRKRVRLSAYSTSLLASFARQNQLTMNTLVQGAWSVLLARYTAESDVLFGSVSAARPPALAGSGELIGPFAVTLPARITLEPAQSLSPWLKELQERQIMARQFEYCSLIDIQGWSDIPRGQQMFESIVAFENYPLGAGAAEPASGLKIELVESIEKTNYPVTLIAFPGDHLEFEIICDSDLDEAPVERLLNHFRILLSSIPEHAVKPVGSLPMLTEGEHHEILASWSGETSGFPRDATIPEVFGGQAERSPDSVALVSGIEQLTYAELERSSELVARDLSQHGVRADGVVGISGHRCLQMIIGLLGILRAGAAYLPVDFSYPSERIRFILENAGARLVLAPGSAVTNVAQEDFELISVEKIVNAGPCQPNAELAETPAIHPDNLAYIVYTSGSTGRPKGVAAAHRSVIRLVKNTNYFGFNSDEVFLQLATLSFDASTFEIWGPLLSGARLVMAPAGISALAEITGLLKQHQVTAAWLTTGLFNLMVREHLEELSKVRQVLTGGDVTAIADARALAERGNGIVVINAYGPTEGTTFTTCHVCNAESFKMPALPIGQPISNTFVYILDQSFNPVPEGVPGELFIGGDGLARGYVQAADLTAERFLPNPFSKDRGQRLYRTGDKARFLSHGLIDFLGRFDSQVKIRGFRIEPGEVESLLASHSAVSQCAVIAHTQESGEHILAAYLAVVPGQEIDAAEAREFLRANLPDYMVPSKFLILDRLPLTANGKVDRKCLRAWDAAPVAAQDYIAPNDPVEQVLAGIWEENLGRERIGLNDDFFELGGHSLAAIRVISAIRFVFKTDLTVSKVFQSPTIEQLARELRAAEAKPGQTEQIARVVQRIQNMSPEERAAILQSRAGRN